MSNLQVKNVPEALHRRIRRLAKQEGKTVRDLILDAIDRSLVRAEWIERHRARERTTLRKTAAQSLDEARSDRERELAR
jgi:hypothetical protein